jgi:hypothetical protein
MKVKYYMYMAVSCKEYTCSYMTGFWQSMLQGTWLIVQVSACQCVRLLIRSCQINWYNKDLIIFTALYYQTMTFQPLRLYHRCHKAFKLKK